MTILRVSKKERFTILSNVHINDERLTWKATAILTYLLSKPNDWSVSIDQLAKAKKCGVKAVFSGVKELKELGYIEHVFMRDEKGRISRGEYIVHEEPVETAETAEAETPAIPESEPHTQKGDAVKRHTVNRRGANRRLLNTDIIPSTESTKNDDERSAKKTPEPLPEKGKKPSSSLKNKKPDKQEAKQKPSLSPEKKPATETPVPPRKIRAVSTGKRQKPVTPPDRWPNRQPEIPDFVDKDINALLPEKFRQPSIIKRIHKALERHSADYVRQTLQYAGQKSRARTVSEFGSFFGKALDFGWSDQLREEQAETVAAESAQKAVRLSKRQQKEAEERKRAEAQEQMRRKNMALVDLNSRSPEEYQALQQRAADALGLNLKNPGLGGHLKIRHEIYRLMDAGEVRV